MKKLLLPFFIFAGFSSQAQLTINDTLTSSQISSLLEGIGVTVSSLTVNCPPLAMGEFSGTSEMSITHGLVLTTGRAADVADSASFFAATANGYPGDADLDTLIGMGMTHDGCVLEFDCLPVGDTLLFNFSFGSEEYPEFVGSAFNDVFSIFLSGPGITGAVNVAALPDSTPVAINNVNPFVNNTYYYDNESPMGNFISYDGFTTNLTAFAVVVPSTTYHFKVAIADVGDEIYDSGVFLEAFSFRSHSSVSSGIAENRLSRLNVFPNPAEGLFFLDDKEGVLQGSTWTVRNVLGQDVATGVVGSDHTRIDISAQDAGMYYLHVESAAGGYDMKLIRK
jgi:hypothetical protein